MTTTRLEMRVPQEIKKLAEKSSALLGNANLTEFVVQAIREKVTRVLNEAKKNPGQRTIVVNIREYSSLTPI